MFLGNYQTRVDEKGRLKVPADFKRVLDESYGTEFYITSRDGKIAEIYPLDEWKKLQQVMRAKPSSAFKNLQTHTSFWGQLVEIDTQGRLLLPGRLRENANLKGDVAVYGFDGTVSYLKVQLYEDYEKLVLENPITPDDTQVFDEAGI